MCSTDVHIATVQNMMFTDYERHFYRFSPKSFSHTAKKDRVVNNILILTYSPIYIITIQQYNVNTKLNFSKGIDGIITNRQKKRDLANQVPFVFIT